MVPWGVLVCCVPKKGRCFDSFARFEVPFLQARRQAVFRVSFVMNLVGFLLALAGALGGMAKGGVLLERLHWARLERGHAVTYAGFAWACKTSKGEVGEVQHCSKITDVDCEHLKASGAQEACQICQAECKGIYLPVVIALLTYLTLELNVHRRSTGKDSLQVKTMACFASFFGGTNFLLVVLGYWKACVKMEETAFDKQGQLGLGLLLIGIGSCALKYVCGVINLCLPVEAQEPEEGDSDSEDDFTSQEASEAQEEQPGKDPRQARWPRPSG